MAGAVTAYFVTRWVTQITSNARAIPWSVWAVAAGTIGVAVAVASIFPARDAMAVDPLSIMRDK
jgi:ABC-type lipoprotein release transport system permease subunit